MQYIHKSNHYVVHLKLTRYYISINLGGKEFWLSPHFLYSTIHQVGTTIILISHMTKLRHWEVEWLAQGHKSNKRRSLDLILVVELQNPDFSIQVKLPFNYEMCTKQYLSTRRNLLFSPFHKWELWEREKNFNSFSKVINSGSLDSKFVLLTSILYTFLKHFET